MNDYSSYSDITAKFFLILALFMAVTIPVVSVVYIYLIYYIPFVWLNMFIASGCGGISGYIVGYAAKQGGTVNSTAIIASTVVSMCVMYYFQWCVYIPLVFTDAYEFYYMTFGERLSETLYYFIRPDWVIEAARFINEFGVWSYGQGVSYRDVAGSLLLFVWVCELAIITGFAVYGVRTYMSKQDPEPKWDGNAF